MVLATPRFEWDPAKARKNLRKHGVPFEYATRVFLDPSRLDREDTCEDYGEERRLTLGAIEGRVFVVAYAIRDSAIRLISARRAVKHEQDTYYQVSS
jgi:hypothetical protein